MNKHTFASELVRWWEDNKRDLPWKSTKDPYRIWISEIILQQTRVEQGKPYYEAFIQNYPDIKSLAEAKEDEVLKLWEGLGYYSRARNLHHTAKYITKDLGGIFPSVHDELLKLKGVGPYTAAAIASFAFDLPHAVVDGNVIRLVSRILGITQAVDNPKIQKEISDFVSASIVHSSPASFNQALMDFGSMVCKPNNPGCEECVFQSFCVAFDKDFVNQIPLKIKKAPRKNRYFHYLDIRINHGDMTIITQRSDSDIWKKLYELPMLETSDASILNEVVLRKISNEILDTYDLNCEIKVLDTKLTQILTHQKIHGIFYEIQLNNKLEKINPPYYLVKRKKVSNFAFPKIINDYIRTAYNN
jgi:A/G-specific adenine glycosylase